MGAIKQKYIEFIDEWNEPQEPIMDDEPLEDLIVPKEGLTLTANIKCKTLKLYGVLALNGYRLETTEGIEILGKETAIQTGTANEK